MERELKFRIFDTKNKRMIYGLTLMNTQSIYNKLPNTLHPADLPIMQYTGMKDKNEKEIYDGDILKSFESVIGIVEYNYGKYFADEITTDDFLPYDVLRNEQRDIEVIGNIYENPELLKSVGKNI